MKTEREPYTVLQACLDYLGTRELRPQSGARYRSLIRALPESFLLQPVGGVVERDVRGALDMLTAGAPSYNKTVMLLRGAFEQAARNRQIAVNPCEYVKCKRMTRADVDPLTFDEMRAVAAACDPAWVGRYVVIRALTGLRSREATGLAWSDVDFEAGTIRVHVTALADGSIQNTPKTERSARTIPLIGLVREALTEQREITGTRTLVFGNAHDRPVALAAISLAWRKALAACGLSYRRPYILRHSFASLALGRGMTLQETAAVLGHSTIQQLVTTYSRFTRTPATLAKLESLGITDAVG